MEKEFGIMPEAMENELSEVEKSLIAKAKEKYGEIKYVSSKKSWGECFTEEDGKKIFWFNTEDNSTRVINETELPN